MQFSSFREIGEKREITVKLYSKFSSSLERKVKRLSRFSNFEDKLFDRITVKRKKLFYLTYSRFVSNNTLPVAASFKEKSESWNLNGYT